MPSLLSDCKTAMLFLCFRGIAPASQAGSAPPQSIAFLSRHSERSEESIFMFFEEDSSLCPYASHVPQAPMA
jgi:hypothetical protein